MAKRDTKGLTVKKSENFSEWYSEIVQKAELADLRYGVKGFLVFQPWSVMAMEQMYAHLESVLQRKGHKPYFYPTLIPESNLKKESEHVEGFVPEVFWVTEAGDTKFDERLALRPTSETAFYQMFGIWIRSYKDLPFKTYQRANVFRYETKATRPFLRSREFHWIEAHCVHATKEDAMKQVHEDMETTKEVLGGVFALPFVFFERPAWDKFPGAYRTFAADVLNPDGRVVQQPSTHFLEEGFSKAFNVTFKDADGKEKYGHITCYGPAVSRILASVIIVHGDDAGLRFPWDIAPVQLAVVPVQDDASVIAKAEGLGKKLAKIARVEVDMSDRTGGEKFNYWEMKGVPLRIDIGKKDMEKKSVTLFRRDLNTKEIVPEDHLLKRIKEISAEFTDNLRTQAGEVFEHRVSDVGSLKELKKVIETGGMARCGFCSVDNDGEACAEVIEKETGAKVRGTSLEREEPGSKMKSCVICGNDANVVVYIARDY